MPDIQKVSIALTSEQVTILKAAVETGEYATTSEIVREAIRDCSSSTSCATKTLNVFALCGPRGKPVGQLNRWILLSYAKRHGNV